MCRFLSPQKLAAPFSARLFDSVAPLVNTISLSVAPIRLATYCRATSHACSVSHPKLCDLECGLPKFSVRNGSILSSTLKACYSFEKNIPWVKWRRRLVIKIQRLGKRRASLNFQNYFQSEYQLNLPLEPVVRVTEKARDVKGDIRCLMTFIIS